MVISKVQTATATDDTNGGTGFINSIDVIFTAPPTDGNTLIVCVMAKDANTPNINSVTSSNTSWTEAVEEISGFNTDAACAIWYASNISGAGSTITVNMSNARTVAVTAYEYSGIDPTDSLELTAVNSTSSFSQSNLNITASSAITKDESLIVAVLASNNSSSNNTTTTFVSSSYTLDQNFNIINSVPSTFGAANLIGLVAEKITGSIETPSITMDGNVATNDVFVGALAAFNSAPPTKAVNPDPADSAIDVLPSKVLEWDAGDFTDEYEIFISTDPDPSGDSYGTLTATQFKTPEDFDLNTTIYWRVDSTGDGGSVTGDVWSFTTIEELQPPTQTSTPTPEDSATLIPPGTLLTWQPGQSQSATFEPVTHNVFLSTNFDEVSTDDITGNSFKANVSGNSFRLTKELLTPGAVHYWRVDSVDGGGETKGEVWSFTAEPVIYDFPRPGDRVFNKVILKGRVPPLNGVNTELHTDNGFLTDGYTIAAENGQFCQVISYSPLIPGTKIRAVSVAQASPDSEEVTIELVQASDQLGPVKTRTAKRLNVDSDTVAFWRMGKTVLAEAQTSSSEPKLNFSFNTIGGDERDAPGFFTLAASTETLFPRFTGVLTYYNFNITDSFSRVNRFNTDSVTAFFSDGFTIRLGHRSVRGNVFAPNENNHNIAFFADDEYRIRIFGGQDQFILVNDQKTVSFTQLDDIDYFRDWARIELRGYELAPGASSAYVELYVNDILVEQGWGETTGDQVTYFGNFFSGGNFYAAQIDDFILMEGNPFVERIGTNVQGDSSIDLNVVPGCNTMTTDDPDVPFTHCARFDGSTGVMYTDSAAVEVSTPFTVEGWFRRNNVEREEVIIGKESFNSNGWQLSVDIDDNLLYRCANGSLTTVTGPGVIRNRWYYFALVHDGTDLVGYLDGKEVGRATGGITINTAQDLEIGRDSSSSSLYFEGDIAEVRMSNVARKSWEIYGTYNAVDDPQIGFVADKDTIALWDFDSDPGRLTVTSNRSYQSPYKIQFNNQEQVDKIFPIEDRSSSFADGLSTIEFADPVGSDTGAARMEIFGEQVVDDPTFLIAGTRGGLRLSGDFSITARLKPTLNPAPLTSNQVIGASDYFDMRVRTNVEVNSTYRIDLYTSSGNPTINIDYNLYGQVGSVAGLDFITIDEIFLRVDREGNTWRGFYKLDENDPWISQGENAGPEQDCYIQFVFFRNDTQTQANNMADIEYYWDILELDVLARERVELDGYGFIDALGGASEGTQFDRSPVGFRSRVFDGIDDYLIIPTSDELNHQDLTIESWFSVETLHNGKIISRIDDAYGTGFSMSVGSDGYLAAEIIDEEGESVQVSAGTITDGVWYYAAATYDVSESKLSLFLDGRMIGQTSNSSMSGNHSSDAPVYIGRYSTDGDYFDGKISDIKLSNVVKQPVEIFNTFKGAKVKQ